ATMGTPEYMAPEQALDPRNADIRADVYSLGCTLFFLLTGKPPFTGQSSYAVVDAHKTQPPQNLTDIRQDIPRELSDLVNRLLAKSPHGRPKSPAEVVCALDRLLLSPTGPVPVERPKEDSAPSTPVVSQGTGPSQGPPDEQRPPAGHRWLALVILFGG